MTRDKYQQAWQSYSDQTRVMVDADLLLQEVRHGQRSLRRSILVGNVTDLVIGLLLLPTWFYLGIRTESPWTWYLTVPVIIWGIGFALVRLMRRYQPATEPGEPLLNSVKESLAMLDQQIWLTRNGFRLSILPFAVSVVIFSAHSAWLRSRDWLDLFCHADVVVFQLAVFCFLYYCMQFMRPGCCERRRDLLKLLAGLGEESAANQIATDIEEGSNRPGRLRRLTAVGGICLAVPVLLAVTGDFIEDHRSDRPARSVDVHSDEIVYAKKSPFTGVRWQESQPEVRLGEEWFQLVGLNDLTVSEMRDFGRKTYRDQWRKRFEEDLVELLTRMGHPPSDTVSLVIRPLTSAETQIRKDVPMTEENRSMIYRARHSTNEKRTATSN